MLRINCLGILAGKMGFRIFCFVLGGGWNLYPSLFSFYLQTASYICV